jgi:hypothetical protein
MPEVDAQFYIQGGGVFVARYLSWHEDRAEVAEVRSSRKSSIACDPYRASPENADDYQLNPCVVSVFRCTFEGLHSERLPGEPVTLSGGGAISLMGMSTSEFGPTSSTIMHVAESVFRGCSAVRARPSAPRSATLQSLHSGAGLVNTAETERVELQ